MTRLQKHHLVLSSYSRTGSIETVGFIINGREQRREFNWWGKGGEKLGKVTDGIKLIKQATLLCPEISELNRVLIDEVGIEGLRNCVRVEIDSELITEIKYRAVGFSIPLLQAIDAINQDTQVSERTGLDVSYKEMKFICDSDDTVPNLDWLTGERFANMFK